MSIWECSLSTFSNCFVYAEAIKLKISSSFGTFLSRPLRLKESLFGFFSSVESAYSDLGSFVGFSAFSFFEGKVILDPEEEQFPIYFFLFKLSEIQ